jgi:hypothetical protein
MVGVIIVGFVCKIVLQDLAGSQFPPKHKCTTVHTTGISLVNDKDVTNNHPPIEINIKSNTIGIQRSLSVLSASV